MYFKSGEDETWMLEELQDRGAFLQQWTSWKLQGNGNSAGGPRTLPLANSYNDCCRNHLGYVSTVHCFCTLHLSPPKHTDNLIRQEEIPEQQGLQCAHEAELVPRPKTALRPNTTICLSLLCCTSTLAAQTGLLKRLPFLSKYSPILPKPHYCHDCGARGNDELTAEGRRASGLSWLYSN